LALGGGVVVRPGGATHLVYVRGLYVGVGGPAPSLLWPLMRRRLLRADALACISEAVRSQFGGAPHALLLRDGLTRTPQATPRSEARAALGLPDDRLVVALVGRISDWKGQDVLARALAEPALADIGAIGLVAGDEVPGSGHAKRLDGVAATLGVGARLRRLGFRNDVDTVLGAADVLVVPSTRPEPLGLVALEAAAAGLPVVASDAGGLPEIVRDGKSGLLVPPGDSEALAAALAGLAASPGRAADMGRAGAAQVAHHFTEERMLDQLQSLYDRLAA
ncbi:MAG: glycosyltransferase family 4 protein, partial [Thermoleophilaceae bacterium]